MVGIAGISMVDASFCRALRRSSSVVVVSWSVISGVEYPSCIDEPDEVDEDDEERRYSGEAEDDDLALFLFLFFLSLDAPDGDDDGDEKGT